MRKSDFPDLNDKAFNEDAADLAQGLGNAAASLGKGFARSRAGKWMITLWVLGAVVSLTLTGVIIWGIIQLVKHFTAG